MRDYSICPIDINRPEGSRIKLGIHWSNRRDAINRVSTVCNSLANKQCCFILCKI